MTHSNKQARFVGAKVTQREYEEISELVDAGAFSSASDFVREAIRDKLKGIEVIEIRDVDYETAKKEILDYYQKYKEADLSEVSEKLRLDLQLVFQITNDLIEEGRLK